MKNTLTLIILLFGSHLLVAQHISTSDQPSTDTDIYHLSGKLGVGTSVPGASIHINNDTSPAGLRISAVFPLIQLRDHNFPTSQGGWNIENGREGPGVFGLYAEGVGTKFSINRDGKVGIGTADPKRTLDIQGTMKIKSLAPIIELAEEDNNKAWFMVADGKHFDIRNGSLSTTAFRINDQGYIGINANPTAKLHVNGNLRVYGGSLAKGVSALTVDNTFADYSADIEMNRPLTIRRSDRNAESMNVYIQDTHLSLIHI